MPCFTDVGFQITKLGETSAKDLAFDHIKERATGRKVGGTFGRGFDIWDIKEHAKKYNLQSRGKPV